MLRQFEMFRDKRLRDAYVEKVYRHMESRKFKHGFKPYKEGVDETDGLYFIQSGDFEITKIGKVANDQTKAGLKTTRKALMYRDNEKSIMNQSRSQLLLQKIDKTLKPAPEGHKKKLIQQTSVLRLGILTTHDTFGLDEIMQDYSYRQMSVQCVSKEGECLFLSRENFLNCVNKFQFHRQISNLMYDKMKNYNGRIKETQAFQNRFLNQQYSILNAITAKEKAHRDAEMQEQTVLQSKIYKETQKVETIGSANVTVHVDKMCITPPTQSSPVILKYKQHVKDTYDARIPKNALELLHSDVNFGDLALSLKKR